MTKSTLGQVVQRAIGDAAFRRQLQTDPTGALKGFNLTAEERAALTSADPGRLTGLGVDQRMSKVFALGEASSSSRVGTGTDLSVGATTPGESPLISEGLVSGPRGASDALIPSGEAGAGSFKVSGDPAGARAAVSGEQDQFAASFPGDTVESVRGAAADQATTGARSALGDQHDGGRAAIGGEGDATASVIRDPGNPAWSGNAVGDDATGGARSALGDQHDGGRAAIGGEASGSGDSAFVTSDEMGGGMSTDAFMTADELADDAAAADTDASGLQAREADIDSDASLADPTEYGSPPDKWDA